MNRCVKICLLLTFLFVPFFAFPQNSKKDLERKKEQLKKEIETTNKLLLETRKNQQASLSELSALKRKIQQRIELLNTINEELNLLDKEIVTTGGEIKKLESELEQLKAGYANMIKQAHVNQNAYQRLAFLFASEDFNQAYKRVKYFQQYSSSRKLQAEKIEETVSELANKNNLLVHTRAQKSTIKNQEEQQKKSLDKERKEQAQLLSTLQEREKKLKKDLNDKQAAEKKLNKAITDIIKREIAAAQKKAAAAGTKNISASNALTLTPEAKMLSSGFENNKGKLPWPVDQGFISSTFGEHPHPVLKGIKTRNNGIDIATRKGTAARALFDGEVTGIVSIPGANDAIIIRHGEYVSVYSNLSEVQVKKGDKVVTKQPLGTVYTNEESKTEIHLEIWKGTDKLDPSAWIFKK